VIRVKLSFVGGIKDNNGNPLAADYTFQFGTGTTPTTPVSLGFESGDLSAWPTNGDAAVRFVVGGSLRPELGGRGARVARLELAVVVVVRLARGAIELDRAQRLHRAALFRRRACRGVGQRRRDVDAQRLRAEPGRQRSGGRHASS
jgi:hypothetical protein